MMNREKLVAILNGTFDPAKASANATPVIIASEESKVCAARLADIIRPRRVGTIAKVTLQSMQLVPMF